MANPNPKRESMWLNLGFNLVLPILLLRKGEAWFGAELAEALGAPKGGTEVDSVILAVAVAFPVGYGLWDLRRRKRWNFISILGAVSTLLTGGIGLIPGGTAFLFAVKETALPAILAILTVTTLRTEKPLVKLFLYNPDFLNVNLVEEALREKGTKLEFDDLLKRCTWYLAGSFILSAVLNYGLARWLVTDDPGEVGSRYNEQVGEMMTWSYVVISIPCMVVTFYAFYLLVKGIKKYAGLELEGLLPGANEDKREESEGESR